MVTGKIIYKFISVSTKTTILYVIQTIMARILPIDTRGGDFYSVFIPQHTYHGIFSCQSQQIFLFCQYVPTRLINYKDVAHGQYDPTKQLVRSDIDGSAKKFGLSSNIMGRNPLDPRYGQCTLPSQITEIFRSIMLLGSFTVMTPIFTIASFRFHRRFFCFSPTVLSDFTDASFGFHRRFFWISPWILFLVSQYIFASL